MVMQNMANKESFLLFPGQENQPFAIRAVEGQSIFHKDMFVGLLGFFCNFKMKGVPGNNYTRDIIILGDIGDIGGDEYIRIGLAHVLTNGLSAVADDFKNAKQMELTNKVPFPVSGTDTANVF
jgi:hypothetical protein